MTEALFNYTYPTGFVFSPSERVALATSVPLLATSIKKTNLFLWGKIFGFKKDYIILKAFGDDLVAEEPELFYSVDEGLTFTLLGTTTSLLGEDVATGFINMENPLDVQEKKLYLLKQMQGLFMGDPAYEYRVYRTPEAAAAAAVAAAEAAASGAKPKEIEGEVMSFKESVRLALFVEEHDYHCRVAPRGAYYRAEKNKSENTTSAASPAVANGASFTGDVRRNDAFQGLNRASGDAVSLHSYYHIRKPNAYRKFLCEHHHGSGALYFISGNTEKNSFELFAENQKIDAPFESLGHDLPSGLWRLKYDPMAGVVLGSHAYFPGSLFFHVPESSIYGNVYMGDGTINNDVAFEI